MKRLARHVVQMCSRGTSKPTQIAIQQGHPKMLRLKDLTPLCLSIYISIRWADVNRFYLLVLVDIPSLLDSPQST